MAPQKKSSDATQFTYESAQRIANVVRSAELATPAASPLVFDSAIGQPAPVRDNVKLVTVSGSWLKGQTKTVTFTGGATATATNYLFNVIGDTTSNKCVIVKVNGEWTFASGAKKHCSASLAATEISSSATPGSSLGTLSAGSEAQVLVNDSGCARWFGCREINVVTDVYWNGTSLIKSQKTVKVLTDASNPASAVVFTADPC